MATREEGERLDGVKIQDISQADQIFLLLPRDGSGNISANGLVKLDLEQCEPLKKEHLLKAFRLVQDRHMRTTAWLDTTKQPPTFRYPSKSSSTTTLTTQIDSIPPQL